MAAVEPAASKLQFDYAAVEAAISTRWGDVEFVELIGGLRHPSTRDSEVTFVLAGRAMTMVRRGKKLSEASLDEIVETWQETEVLMPGALELRDDRGNLVAQLVIQSVRIKRAPDDRAVVDQLDGVVFWPAATIDD